MIARILIGSTLLVVGLAVGGCDNRSDRNASTRPSTPANPTATGPNADNTARNAADRDNTAKTPMDQSNASADIRITADIRKAILADDAMSVNAQNCKVITDKSGVVTLRGPVASQAEKDSIESKARAVTGVTRVVNELEFKQN